MRKYIVSRRASRLTCRILLLTALVASPAQADDSKLFLAEAAIPNSRVIRFTSAIDGEPFSIEVSIPMFAPRSKAGYPVIYVLDGELYLPEAAIASDFLGENAAVVVGIGHNALNDKSVIARYANSKPVNDKSAGATALSVFQALRDYNFIWPVSPEHRAPAFVEKVIGPETGDVDAFLQVIEKEIKPRVEAMIPIDRSNQALFGHSSGGLAVVRALFTEPRVSIAAIVARWGLAARTK